MPDTLNPQRYVVIPGEVISRTDGQRHFVGVGHLLELYRVPPDARLLILDTDAKRRSYHPLPDDYVIEPRFDGDYPVFLP